MYSTFKVSKFFIFKECNVFKLSIMIQIRLKDIVVMTQKLIGLSLLLEAV